MSGPRRNREILTGGKKYAQKQAKKHQVEEVKFDKDSRVEYLTGFHKRKLQRKKNAQKYIKEQERLARIEERKRMRDERKQDLENQMKQFDETMKKITNYGSDEEDEQDEEWSGIDSDGEEKEEDPKEEAKEELPRGIIRQKQVYIADPSLSTETGAIIDDETTVTVESLENPALATLKELAKANNVNLDKSKEVLDKSIKRAKNYAVVCGVAKPEKKKKKNFRYLTKAERRENLRKEKSKSNARRRKDK